MMQVFKRLWTEEEGQDLAEYALLLVLIALVAISAVRGIAGAISNVFSNAAAGLSTTTS